MSIADYEFLARMMGAPARAERVAGDGGLSASKLQAWVAAAVGNPEKRAAGVARIGTLLDMLPTAEDAARVPAEEPQPVRNHCEMVFDGCPCQSGGRFVLCHGASDYAGRA